MKLKEKSLTYKSLYPAMHHIYLILSWLEVMLRSIMSKTKVDLIPVLHVRHSPISLHILASSDSESNAMK